MERKSPPNPMRDLRLFVLMLLSAVFLLVMLADEKTKLKRCKIQIASLEEKLIQAKNTVRKYKDVLLPRSNRITNPTLLSEKSLRTVVTETLEKVGIVRNVESIDPRIDEKKALFSTRVSLRSVPLRRIVEFVVALKDLGAGIVDREALMRMEGYNRDLWRVELVLEAPMPSRHNRQLKEAKSAASNPGQKTK